MKGDWRNGFACRASHVPYIILCSEDATDAGVLDGHLETSPLDLKESADFLEVVRQKLRLHGSRMGSTH